MEGFSFVRNYMGIAGWEQATVTEKESNNIQKQLREANNRIYQEALQDAHNMLKRFIVAYSNPMKQIQQTADRLFEKRAIHSLTAYQEFLKSKVEKLRKNGEGEVV